jgi:hypothetical protein
MSAIPPSLTERMSAIDIADMEILDLDGYEWNSPLGNDELSPNNDVFLNLPHNFHSKSDVCPNIQDCCMVSSLPFQAKNGKFRSARCKQK